jgi:hypothetical protein
MSTQEMLTYLFDAIVLGFLTIAAIDFGTRVVAAYNQATFASNSPLTNIQPPLTQLPPPAILQKFPQLLDPWLLPSSVKESIGLVKLVHKEQKHLRLLPPAKETSMVVAPKLEDLLRGISIDKLKLRQARKIAKVLGITQKVNGCDQKLEFLRSQIKLKLQQLLLLPNVEVVREDLVACELQIIYC